jgi:dimethylsulfoniopropionate demethylase
MEAGEEFGIRPGCPNLIERIEAGLLTYGTDVTRAHTALEAGLERYCSLDADVDAIGLDALRSQREAGVTRRVAGFMIEGDRVPPNRNGWNVTIDGTPVGEVTSAVWSPRLATNVALGMLRRPHDAVGTNVTVHAPDGDRQARVVEVPFPGASQR